MPPMRANSPVNSDFGVLNAPEDPSAVDALSLEVKQLAKEANSVKGSIILNHLRQRIEDKKKVLFGETLSLMPMAEIGQRFMATMDVISELESIIRDCEKATRAVKDADATDKAI